MNTLYIDCRMGISGTKLLGALIDLLENPELFVRRFNEIGFEGVRLERNIEAAKGISGSQVKFRKTSSNASDMYADEIDADDEEAIRESKARHSHTHVRRLNEVIGIIDDLPLSGKVRKRAISIYENITKATAVANGKDVNDVRLHRTGSRDIIASVVGVCMLLEDFEFEKIIASPVATGTGFAMTSKGNLPIPIPALQNLLKEIPYLAGSEEGEICTLEGAAILNEIAYSFEDMPELSIIRSGAGFGQRTFKNGVNCVRVYIGNIISSSANSTITELEAYLCDDNSGSLNLVYERIIAEGAIEVYAIPVSLQNGFLLKCICDNEYADVIASVILRNTSAKNVRRQSVAAYAPERKIISSETSLGNVRVESFTGFGKNEKRPYREDVETISNERGMSYYEVMKILSKEID